MTVVAVLLGGALLGSWTCGHPGRRGPAAARPRSALPPPGPHLTPTTSAPLTRGTTTRRRQPDLANLD
ncbi:MAG: hypothetical protein LC721_08765, partial [Actinobacteria bacterium]|nr:hypothetical protein [Actinomycetota bacterium]